MTQVRLTEVGKQYGARWVLRHVGFHVSAGERWGVVGRNGEGKTTLLRLVSGEDTPTEGEVWRHPGVRFSIMRQDGLPADPAATVEQAALAPFAELLEMERRLETDAAELGTLDPETDRGARRLREYDERLEQFRRRGGYEMRARAHAALEGLGFPAERWEQRVESLSGGEQGRLRLAQTLLAGPDVLLLDEPTNHLDLRSTEWLEGFLREYPGTVLVVSHDRAFLENLADHVVHVEEGTAYAYSGGYASFLEQRAARRERQRKEHEKQRAHILRTEEFIRRNLAGQKTKQAKSRRTLLERMERIEAPSSEERAMALRFDGSRRSGGTVLRLDGVVCGYGQPLFAPFSGEVGRGERVAIVGPNGSGKSTLLRALAGEAEPSAGEVVRGTGVRPAHHRQDFSHLDPDRSIRQEVDAAAPRLGMQELRAHLGRFLFTGDEIEARIGDLSGGEQARVALAIATLRGANLLLLDEPTNHLDIQSREALEEALESFDGTVVMISHDRAFLSALSTRVWAMPEATGGAIEDYPGGFDAWVAHRAERRPEPPRGGTRDDRAGGSVRGEPDRPESLSKNEIRRRREAMERLESRIAELETELARVEATLAEPGLYAAGADPERIRALTAERESLSAELEARVAEWERVGEELAAAV